MINFSEYTRYMCPHCEVIPTFRTFNELKTHLYSVHSMQSMSVSDIYNYLNQ